MPLAGQPSWTIWPRMNMYIYHTQIKMMASQSPICFTATAYIRGLRKWRVFQVEWTTRQTCILSARYILIFTQLRDKHEPLPAATIIKHYQRVLSIIKHRKPSLTITNHYELLLTINETSCISINHLLSIIGHQLNMNKHHLTIVFHHPTIL